MHYPPPEFGFVNKEEQAKRVRLYNRRVQRALDYYAEWRQRAISLGVLPEWRTPSQQAFADRHYKRIMIGQPPRIYLS
jgi:hypothetical protein